LGLEFFEPIQQQHRHLIILAPNKQTKKHDRTASNQPMRSSIKQTDGHTTKRQTNTNIRFVLYSQEQCQQLQSNGAKANELPLDRIADDLKTGHHQQQQPEMARSVSGVQPTLVMLIVARFCDDRSICLHTHNSLHFQPVAKCRLTAADTAAVLLTDSSGLLT
jgi:hypothetical protein